jgi:hypothetical protein
MLQLVYQFTTSAKTTCCYTVKTIKGYKSYEYNVSSDMLECTNMIFNFLMVLTV